MNPELLNLIVNLGGTGILVWLVMEMRAEAKRDREQLWNLTVYLIKRDDPGFDSQIVKLPSSKPTTD